MRFYNDIIKVRKSVKILEMQVIIYLTIEVKGYARNYLSRNGSHYISMVFGYYSDRARSYYADYWIVWDSKKERLIKWPTFKPKKKFLEKQILIVDAE